MTTALSSTFTEEAAVAAGGPAWLVERRREAMARFAATPLPTPEEEVWRYSRISDLALDRYRPAGPGDRASRPTIDLPVDTATTAVIRTENGRVAEVLADQPGITVSHGDDLAADGPLGSVLGTEGDALTSLHDAFCQPVVVEVADNTEGAFVLVTHTFDGDGVASFPRLVVSAGPNSSVTVVELHASPDGVANLTVPVTELIAERDARLSHAAVQVLGDATWQIGRLVSTVGASATLRAGTAAFGGDYARLRTDTTMGGRGGHGELVAAYFGDGHQLLDFRTFQDHTAPDTTSNLLFKGAVGEHGASVYTGLIKIRPGARGVQAFQTNRNIQLSDDAWAESVPNLEIENNEVQCSHASTVGPVDAEQLFYLESRGVPTARAERLIVRGFFDEVLDGIDVGPCRQIVRDALAASLERSMP